MTSDITVSASSIGRAFNRAGGDDMWLHVTTKTSDMSAMTAAVAEANEVASTRTEDLEVKGAVPVSTPGGFAVQLVAASSMGAVRGWVADLAAALRRRDVTAVLAGIPEARAACLEAGLGVEPSGYVAYVLSRSLMDDERHLSAGWLVEKGATARITQLADRWARRANAQLLLVQGGFSMAIDLGDASTAVARSVTESGVAGVDFLLSRKEATHVALSYGGEGIFQIVGGSSSWRDRVSTLTMALTANPQDVEQGYIRSSPRGTISHDAIDNVYPLPGISEIDLRYNKHLLDRYLPDAHGIQVVQSMHLENSRDLSDWKISELGRHRYLVEARDLEPWYSDSLPSVEVLAQARSDFEGALLTREIIADNPPDPGFRLE